MSRGRSGPLRDTPSGSLGQASERNPVPHSRRQYILHRALPVLFQKGRERTTLASGKWITELKATTPVADAARHVLTVRLEVVRDYLPLALQQADKDPEHVHQLRVGTRRARAALDIFACCLPLKVYNGARKHLRLHPSGRRGGPRLGRFPCRLDPVGPRAREKTVAWAGLPGWLRRGKSGGSPAQARGGRQGLPLRL